MGRKVFYQAWVSGRSGKLHKLTPDQIISDLKKDIELGREWSIDPKELIEIISKPEFSEYKSNEIKAIILDYCAGLLTGDVVLGEEPLDIHIITYCYHTSYGDDAVAAKLHYKQSVLSSTIDHYLAKHSDAVANIGDSDLKKWRKNWEATAIKNFYRFFGPELTRWELKIRKKSGYDFEKFFANELAPEPTPLQETGN